jgi:hypothetical protein
MLARVRRGLPDRETFAPLVANLYADLLINDRLQRQAALDMAGVYKAINVPLQTPLWKFYLRTYEILWSLPRGTLTELPLEDSLEADAGLAARVVRSFAQDWLDGAGRFAVLCLTYLLAEKTCDLKTACRAVGGWCDTISAGQGADDVPAGLIDIDSDEAGGILHPMFDPDLSGVDLGERGVDIIGKANALSSQGGSAGQCREPFEFGQILRALGLDMSDHDIAVRYYRERALPAILCRKGWMPGIWANPWSTSIGWRRCWPAPLSCRASLRGSASGEPAKGWIPKSGRSTWTCTSIAPAPCPTRSECSPRLLWREQSSRCLRCAWVRPCRLRCGAAQASTKPRAASYAMRCRCCAC